MKIRLSISLFFVLTTSIVVAQEQWSLERCISYALENNINIRQQQLNVEYQKNICEQTNYSALPSVNASIDQSFSLGRSLGQDNSYINNNVSTTSFNVSANVVLFQGLAKYNQRKVSKLDCEAAIQNLEYAKNNVSINVTSAYLDVLFNKELLKIAQEQLLITQEQIALSKQQVDLGTLSEGKLLELESQLANEELDVINSENNLWLSLVALQQMLELPITNNFDIVQPQFDTELKMSALITVDTIYTKAVEERPEIKSKKFAVEGASKKIAIAKAQQYPSISMSAGYRNYYYSMAEGNNAAFSDQFDVNGTKFIGATLNIPIFNGKSARTNVKNSIIYHQNSLLELQESKNILLKEIEQSYVNATAAIKRYFSCQKSVSSCQMSFDYAREKYDLGVITSFEYNEAKNRLTTAKLTFIQAKYDYLFKLKILEFYYYNKLEI